MDVKYKLAVLSKIATVFNENNVLWAVGASTLLYIKGIVDNFNDIDLMIDEKDVDKVTRLLLKLGELKENETSKLYKSKAFLEFCVDNVDVDVIAGFIIVNENTEHYFPLKSSDIQEIVKVNNANIHLHSVDEWEKYYLLMKRYDKVNIIGKSKHYAK